MIHLLLIEENPSEAEWLQQALAQAAAPDVLVIDWHSQLASGLNRLTEISYDIIFLDLNVSDSQGLQTLTKVQQTAPNCPVVVMVESSEPLIATQVMQAGGQDCIISHSINGFDLLRTLQHAMERKHFELALERRAREMEALYQTSLEINAQIDLPTLLQSLVERAIRLMGLPLGGLYLVQPDKHCLTLTYTVNIKKDYRGTTLQFGEGIAGRVAQTGRPLAVANYQEWEGHAKVYAGSEFKRMLAVPLKSGDTVIGVITLIDDRQVGTWNTDEIRLACLFADQAAIAVQNARTLSAERQKSAELERSNAVIAVLGQMATRLSETLDTSVILETLGNELQHLGITALLTLFEEQSPGHLVVRYISAERSQLMMLETILEKKIIGMQILPNVWPMADHVISEKKGRFQRDPIPLLANFFTNISRTTLESALARFGINQYTPVLYLPLVIKDHPLGLMTLWGGDLRENDLIAFTVFANQVAVALENARLYNRIERQAIIDELTGIYNRRGFYLLAEQQLRLAQRTGSDMLLIFCDVDQLKQINDSYGHKEGDRALVLMADALRATFRSADIIARISGDEFAILAYATPSVGAPALMERLKHEVARINSISKSPFTLGVSAGYSLWTSHQTASLDELLTQADAQMYQVKHKKTTGELRSTSISH